jgi:hypothetical protein
VLTVIPELAWLAKLIDRLPNDSAQEKWYFECYAVGLALNGLGFVIDGAILITGTVILGETKCTRTFLDREWHVLGATLLRQSLLALADAAMWPAAGVDRIVPASVVAVRVLFILTSGLLGVLLCLPDFRTRAQAWLAAQGEEVATAAGIAALLGDHDPREVQSKAQELFRCVNLADLSRKDMADSKPNPALYALSTPTLLGDVDAFLSHSWHDDPGLKWEALQAWRRKFIDINRREPKLWIDKCCIDQTNIAANLMW